MSANVSTNMPAFTLPNNRALFKPKLATDFVPFLFSFLLAVHTTERLPHQPADHDSLKPAVNFTISSPFLAAINGSFYAAHGISNFYS
jgi:hypothetical protein